MAESAVQIFKQLTDALHADETRMSFSIKSPGVGVILSPQLILSMDWEIKCPGSLDYRQAMGPIFQPYDTRDLDEDEAKEQSNDGHVMAYTPKICFSSGDAVFKNLTNYQLVINGASVSNSSQNLYKRSLDQCFIPDSVWKTRYAMAGGQYQKYDCQPVSGESYTSGAAGSFSAAGGGRVAYGADPKVVAWTADSGVQSRVEGFLGCITAVLDPDGGQDVYKITVRAPISGVGVFNPLSPDDDMASSCPLQRSLFALAHCNNVQIDLLFDDLKQGLFRNLTSRLPGGGDALATGNVQGGFKVRLMGSGAGEVAPQIHSRWLRLSSWRSIPDVITCSTYRHTVHRASKEKTGDGNTVESIPAEILEGSASVGNAIAPSGFGRRDDARCAQRVTDRYLDVEFRAIQAAQCPTYVFFCMQKSSKIFCLEDDAVGKQISDYSTYAAGAPSDSGAQLDGQASGLRNYFYARNTDSNAAIMNFSMEIQSSVGSYIYASDTEYPFIKTKFELFRDHLKNCCKDYCSNDINIWQKNNSCLLLHASDWLRGLTTTNTAFPVQFNCRLRFENKREFIDGNAASSDRGLTPVLHDLIAGTPVMVMLYPNTSLTLTASSGASSAANFSHSAGLDILSRKV
jgi:hypothetical protein